MNDIGCKTCVCISVQCFDSRMPSYCCKHSCSVVAYLHEVVLISCIRLLLANYLLIVAKIFKSAGRQTTARPAASHSPARPAGCAARAHLYQAA